jgi:hypothetical protein
MIDNFSLSTTSLLIFIVTSVTHVVFSFSHFAALRLRQDTTRLYALSGCGHVCEDSTAQPDFFSKARSVFGIMMENRTMKSFLAAWEEMMIGCIEYLILPRFSGVRLRKSWAKPSRNEKMNSPNKLALRGKKVSELGNSHFLQSRL